VVVTNRGVDILYPMDLPEKKLLDETIELARENNKLIKKIHRSIVIGRTFRILYWVVIIGFALGLFYFLQPYIELLGTLYGNVQDTVHSAQEVFNNASEVQGTTTDLVY